MPHNRVFISYSHEDEKFLQEFLVHLKPFMKDEQLDIWSDKRIVPSDDWDREIQQALEATAVAVLLVSPDFLASDYIDKHELPVLLQAREEGRIELTCLYLRHSVVNNDDAGIEVPLSSGETVSIKLTKYQGFNSPDNVVASLDTNACDKLYADAASDLKALISRKTEKTGHSPTGQRFSLTVQLVRGGPTLTRNYFHQHGKITEYRSAWVGLNNQDVGSSLFDALFGTDTDQYEDILQAVFDGELGRPIRYPVRVRIHTSDPTLAALPWRETRWEGYTLCDYGWTFEFITDAILQAPPNRAQITLLKAPCTVLVIAPGMTPDDAARQLAIEERLENAWPFYHERPQYVASWNNLRHAWQRRHPRIVYYYGPAQNDGQQLSIPFDTDDGVEQRPVTDLTQVWGNDPPQIVFFNFVGNSVSPGTALAGLQAPLIISQNSADPAEARRSALEWLHQVLEGNEDTDPVWALHQSGLTSAVAWGAYGTWQTQTANEPAKETIARLLLDRKTQRSLGNTAVNELVREGGRRLCCVLAYGAEGNLVEQFADQLSEHLRRNAKEVALVHQLRLRLPTPQTFDVTQIAFEVQRTLGMRDRDSLGNALAERKPRGPGRTRPVLLLDWGVRGTTENNRISIASLEAWLEFCSLQLSKQCPRDLRLMSCLSIEIAKDRHSMLEQKIKDLRAEERFRDSSFRLELLPPLEHIEANDLADFLDSSGNSSCPQGLIRDMPDLIVDKTDGQFSETVDLIEQAERSGWYTLYDALQSQPDASLSNATDEDELL